MKRIFKLKGQMIISCFLSVIIGYLICIPFGGLIKREPGYSESMEKIRMYNKDIVRELSSTKLYSSNNSDIQEVFNKISDSYKMKERPELYMTDEKGNILCSNNKQTHQQGRKIRILRLIFKSHSSRSNSPISTL